ncbi:COG1426 Predicted transcriptional regulator contains Xre-like HTH domain [Candidatus Nanopelagicaceae bacterium]
MNLGEVLSSARISAHISLEDLAAATSIRAGLLGEMERNNFTHCGGDIYARGHLRNIAPKIGLDGNDLVALYNAEHSVESRSINEMLAENSVARVPHEKKSISWKVPAGFSLAIVLALAVAQIVITNVNSDSPIKPDVTVSESATPVDESPSPSPSPSAVASDQPTAAATTKPASTGVSLLVSAARGNSLIDIVVDGKHLFKGSLFQGESKSFEATTSISVYFSNPAGLDVTLNGELLASLGDKNQEVRRTFR